MKKVKRFIEIVALMIFSFYYTEKIAIYVQNKTPLKKEIMSFKERNKIDSINAVVDGEYIIPGIYGKIVNENKSYDAMKIYNVFNESKIVYDEIEPELTVKDYPSKIIRSGNKEKNAVSILIDKYSKNSDIFDEEKLKYTTIDSTSYCIIINDDYNCNKGYKVKPLVLNNSNFLRNINNIVPGTIIYISDDLSENYVYLIIKHINFHNLNVLTLDEHLTEKNKL